ncbi:hypothetical protein D3C85_1693350 [compost metagenome]
MAKNARYGDNRRVGMVKERSQSYNPQTVAFDDIVNGVHRRQGPVDVLLNHRIVTERCVAECQSVMPVEQKRQQFLPVFQRRRAWGDRCR